MFQYKESVIESHKNIQNNNLYYKTHQTHTKTHFRFSDFSSKINIFKKMAIKKLSVYVNVHATATVVYVCIVLYLFIY